VYLQIVVRLSKGLGISVVDRTPEELVYILFRDVAIEYVQENEEQTLRADVRSLQVRLGFLNTAFVAKPLALCLCIIVIVSFNSQLKCFVFWRMTGICCCVKFILFIFINMSLS